MKPLFAPPEFPTRLRSAVASLALGDVSPRALEIACGAYPVAPGLADLLPGWRWIALDLDEGALRRAARGRIALLRADAEHLPLAASARFGLILVRHPDVLRRRAWARLLPQLAERLEPHGTLLITLFDPDEAHVVHALPLPRARPLDEKALAPVGPDGRDRVVLAFQVSTVSADV